MIDLAGCGRLEVNEARMHALTEDGGRRYDAFWAWVDRRVPQEPVLFVRLGFRMVDPADAPDGGPRIWFMRWSAAILAP